MGLINEVQIIGLLLAADGKNKGDTLIVSAPSAALAYSHIPWSGSIGCVRVGKINSKFVVDLINEEMLRSRLDLIYIGNEKNMMIESNADQLLKAFSQAIPIDIVIPGSRVRPEMLVPFSHRKTILEGLVEVLHREWRVQLASTTPFDRIEF
jgi:polyribonucleotide nucleotidyltransferase